MKAELLYTRKKSSYAIGITGSKSESNRLLILQAIFPNLQIENLSNSEDTIVLQRALEEKENTIDIHHAGTAMRFLTAYFASSKKAEVVLTGSDRMKERPIKILVDALRELGANIDYLENDGFPPLKISGRKLTKREISISANVSSQYISALMLIAPTLENGLTINLQGKITSIPYIKMTLALLKDVGVRCSFSENTITIASEKSIEDKLISVESDWSSASYFYSIVALSEDLSITLNNYSEESIQGDRALVTMFASLGVDTLFKPEANTILISKNHYSLPEALMLDLSNTPDIAQTIAVVCYALAIGCKLTGLHTLKIKETDRLKALKSELSKLGAEVSITNDSLSIKARVNEMVSAQIDTFQDHRMAMAFAPLALHLPLTINDPAVVSKSFPTFWSDLEELGIIATFK